MRRSIICVSLLLSCASGCLLVADPPLLLDDAPELGWVDVVAARDGICAVHADGSMWCGEPNELELSTFGPLVQIGGAVGQAAVATVCMLDDRGGAQCGGIHGSPGFLLHGSFLEITGDFWAGCALAETRTDCWPLAFGGPAPLVTVAVGEHAICGLDGESSSLVCWGIDEQVEPRLVSAVPSGSFVDVAVGRDVACAVRTEGEVVCWGAEPSTPALAELLGGPAAGRYASVALGAERGCALTERGSVSCWGDRAAAGGSPPPAAPLQDVTISDAYACGIGYDTRLHCW